MALHHIVNPLPAKLAAANLRELAAAHYPENALSAVYPGTWYAEKGLNGSYQSVYNLLTGRDPYPGETANDTYWPDLCAFTFEDCALFWLFLAAAIEAGDL